MTYASEKLYTAVHTLATDEGPLRERIEFALMNLHTLTAEDFDEPEAREEFERIWGFVDRATPTGDEGKIAAAARSLSDQEARDLALAITELDGHYRPIA